MEIIIPLPKIGDVAINTYKDLQSYLKQLELAVHHAQKSVEQFEKEGVEISEDSFICFQHPFLERSLEVDGEKEKNDTLKNLTENYYDELQDVQLRIVIE